jgi:methionine biosynthesis protein MetW
MKAEEKLYQLIWENRSSDVPICLDKGSRSDVALELLDVGTRLLDVGCGAGTLCYFAKEKYEDVYGIDISENALNMAKRYNIKISKVNLNEEKLPFEDGYFDAITCLDVIEHVFEPIDLITEINRVLRIGGILVISSPNIRYWQHLFSLVISGKFPKTSYNKEHYDGGHLHYFTYNDIGSILKSCGFHVIKKCGVFNRNIFKEFSSPGIVIKAIKT